MKGRLFYAIVAGITNALLGVGALFITGIAGGFASGRGWEPVALIGLAVWLGGLAAVLAITRSLFLGKRGPIGSAVAACVAATIVTFAISWGIGVGGLGTVLLVA